MFSPNFYNENAFATFFPSLASPSPSERPDPFQPPKSTRITTAPIPITVKRRTPKVDIGPGPAGEDDIPPLSPTSPLSSSSSLSTVPPATPPKSLSSHSLFTSPSEIITPSTSTLISASTPNISQSPPCKRVRFDKSLTILPYTKSPEESEPIIKSPGTIWTKITDAVTASMRIGSGTTNTGMPLSSSWPGPSSSGSSSFAASSSLTDRRASRKSIDVADIPQVDTQEFEAWKVAKEKCGWEIKVGKIDGSCRVRGSLP